MTTSFKEKARDTAVRIIDRHPGLSRRTRTAYKAAKRTYIRAATLGKRATIGGSAPQNIYHASIQRTGSRWIRSVFSDPRVQQHTGLWTYPQHEYEIGDHHDSFPKYTFVPGLYVSYEQYLRIDKPKSYKTLYVIRDPRNATISWYRSMKKTHKLVNDSVRYFRNKFEKMDEKEGIMEAIKYYQVKISFMKEWYMQSKKNDNVKVVRFEDVVESPKKELNKVFRKLGVNIRKEVICEVAESNSKIKMRKRDKRRRGGKKNDYEKRKTDWRRDFEYEHKKEFERVNGKAAKIMGYEK